MAIPSEVATAAIVGAGGIIGAILTKKSTDKKSGSDLATEQLRLALARIKDLEDYQHEAQKENNALGRECERLAAKVELLEQKIATLTALKKTPTFPAMPDCGGFRFGGA